MKIAVIVTAAALIAGCSSYSEKLGERGTYLLPTSNKSIDVVLHRSDIRFLDCGTLTVIQTYNDIGALIDAKEARGQALHCNVIQSAIEAGGRVGAAAMTQPARTTLRNTLSNAQVQVQGQGQQQGQYQEAQGGAGGNGGDGGQGGQGGNGGNSNHSGGGDDTNPGGGGNDGGVGNPGQGGGNN